MTAWQRIIVAAGLVFTLPAVAVACKVPVFRYALERWPADRYRIVAIVNGSASDEQSAAIELLRSIDDSQVNLVSEIVDLSTLSEAELWSVEGLDRTDQAPILQVFYPERDGQRRICWTGDLSTANVKAWIDSPLRREIVDDVRSGVSAVWVLIEGTNDAENADLYAELQAALASATEAISIPEGVIQRRDAAAFLRDNPAASMDDVLRCDIPLQIKFSIRRLGVDDANEMAMRAMINGWTDSVELPSVFPIFGRGRMIEPLAGSDFTEPSVLAACRYMVGECSCSVKALNPGVDLILNHDWQQSLGDQIVLVDAVVMSEPQQLTIPPGRKETAGAELNLEIEVTEKSNRTEYWVYAVFGLGALAFWLKLRMGGFS